MKLHRAMFLSFIFGLLQHDLILAKSQKCCSSKCSISKNTWLPRSFGSYQIHELIAQKKRIQADCQKEDNQRDLLAFDDQDAFLTQPKKSLQDQFELSKNNTIQSENNVKAQQAAVPSHIKPHIKPQKKQDFNSQDLDIFDKEKDYAFVDSDEPEKTTSSLSSIVQKVKEKTRNLLTYFNTDKKKTVQKDNSAPTLISQPKKLAQGLPIKDSGKQDDVDMQQLVEEMREELEDNKEYVRKKLFYENKCRGDSQYNSVCLSFLMEYMQNFGGKCGERCKNLGSMPFWSGTNQMTVGRNDGRADLDAYQLGMGNIPVDENGIGGVIQLNPKVQYTGADIFMQWTHKRNEPCLYFKLHIPFGAIMIHPNLTELVQAKPDESVSFTQVTANPGSSTIRYQFSRYPSPFFRPKSVSEAFFGGSCSKNLLDGNSSFPISLRKGRIAVDKLSEVRFGDINFALGYNIVNNECGFFGAAFKVSCPTGNVPFGDYMLESFFGRAGLWGVGLDISGLYNLWSNQSGTRFLNIAVQGELLHLMNGRTPNFRTFDLCLNGPGSKYLIVQKYVGAYNHVTSGSITKEIMNSCIIQPAANITTLPVISNIGIEGALAGTLNYCSNNWNFDLGVEFWGRSAERLQIDTRAAVSFRLPNLNDFAVLGRQLSSYLIDGQPAYVDTFYCEPLARIGQSQDAVQLIGSPATVTKPAYVNLPEGIADARIASNRIPADLYEALNIRGAQASSVFTGKVFGQAGYTWVDHCYMPSLGIVAGVEFTDNTNNIVQLWSIGLNGSLLF